MDGMTRASFRTICFEYGAEGATTEMIQSLALGRAKRRLSEAFAETMIRLPGEGNLAAQLIGSHPESMGASAKRLTDLNRFDAIEINMGCPNRKVVGSGNGAALLQNPERAIEVMDAVRRNTHLPVRLKLRLGWDDGHIVAPMLSRAAGEMDFECVTVHGRTRAQMYQGPVNIPAICQVVSACNIPVFANGGVTCAEDALTFLNNTQAAGVAIGRAALKQPWIFDDIRRLRNGQPAKARDVAERVSVLTRLAALACGLRPEPVAMAEMRKFSRWLLTGLTGAEEILGAINHITTLNEYRKALEAYLDRLQIAGDVYIHPEYAGEQDLNTKQSM